LVVDRLTGDGRTTFSNFVHLDHSLAVRAIDQSTVRLDNGPIPIWITAIGQMSFALVKGQLEPRIEGWQSQSFGELTANTVLTLTGDMALPSWTAYAISRVEPVSLELNRSNAKPTVTVTHSGHRFPFVPEEWDRSVR